MKQEEADVQWKFSRSKLFLEFFKESTSVAVPFNIILLPIELVKMAIDKVKEVLSKEQKTEKRKSVISNNIEMPQIKKVKGLQVNQNGFEKDAHKKIVFFI